MGRILEIYDGKDGVSRVAKVKTKNGIIIRPFQRIYPLELGTTSESNSKEVITTEKKRKNKKKEEKNENSVQRSRFGRILKAPARLGVE